MKRSPASVTSSAEPGTSLNINSWILMRSHRSFVPRIGFIRVKYIEPESIPRVATEPIPSPRRDLTKAKPVSDELFRAYRSLYSYDEAPLSATVEPYQGRRRLEGGEDHVRGSIR